MGQNKDEVLDSNICIIDTLDETRSLYKMFRIDAKREDKLRQVLKEIRRCCPWDIAEDILRRTDLTGQEMGYILFLMGEAYGIWARSQDMTYDAKQSCADYIR